MFEVVFAGRVAVNREQLQSYPHVHIHDYNDEEEELREYVYNLREITAALVLVARASNFKVDTIR